MNLQEATIKKILEAKQVGTIYHYTSIHNVFSICRSNTLCSRYNPQYSSFYNSSPIKNGVQCFTRRNDLLNANWSVDGTDVKFIVDGDLLSNYYKIEPINALGSKERFEAEERVYANKIENFSKFVIGVEISNKALYHIRRDANGSEWEYYIDMYSDYYDEDKNRFYAKKCYDNILNECRKVFKNVKEV